MLRLSDSGTKDKQLFLHPFLHGVGTAGTLQHHTDVMSGHVCLAPIHGACLCHPLPLQTAWQGFARPTRLRTWKHCVARMAATMVVPHKDRGYIECIQSVIPFAKHRLPGHLEAPNRSGNCACKLAFGTNHTPLAPMAPCCEVAPSASRKTEALAGAG